MSIFERIRKKETIEKGIKEYFQMMDSYVPVFRTFEGSLYEMELTRAAVHSFATHVSKLKPEVSGANNEALQRMLQFKPNPLMDTKKYLYRLATVYMTDNTAFIVPLYDKYGDICGYYPLATEKTDIVKSDGVTYLRYDWGDGERSAIEMDRVGIMNQFQYRNELFGESNAALKPTMDLINVNNQGIVEGVKSSASIRFMAKLASVLKAKDIDDERKRFVDSNLSSKNRGGVLMFDQKYEDIKQITSTPFIVDSEQMKTIQENVFQYFGTNKKILTNSYTSAEWNAYYEGKIEPFAIEASLVHSNMTFSNRELSFGNQIMFTANRMQYMSAAEKVQMVATLFDRGFITLNDGRDIFNLPHVENGDTRYIRKEYVNTDMIDSILVNAEGGIDAGLKDPRISSDEPIDDIAGTEEAQQ